MATGEPFDLAFVTADRKRGTGGELKEVKGYKKVMSEIVETRQVGEFNRVNAIATKDPGHHEHKTLNIYNPQNETDHIITIHWRLMVYFNHKRIIG